MAVTIERARPVTEMIQTSQHSAFLGRRSFVPRPLSDATEIYDTDFEDDVSSDSLDSASTLSSPDEAATPPPTGGLGQYEFIFDDSPVSGPYGPHLFTDQPITFLPVQPKTPRHTFAALTTAVAQLDESKVNNWSPSQVAQWMTEAGFEESVVEKFLIHDICGSVLLDMEFGDLKELDISSFGKRHRVMSSIQHLRNSSMFSADAGLSRKNSTSSKVHHSPSHRRGRHGRKTDSPVVPEESISIVAIEQLLPKPHVCSKGEECSKWKKQQRKIQRLEEEFAADVKSIAAPSVVAPSVVASSDILGPSSAHTITEERLSTVQSRDPHENVRQFLSFQHVNSPVVASPPSPSGKITQQLHGLPRLTIPAGPEQTTSPDRTPISAFKDITATQARLRAELRKDPYHYGGVASPVDVYRLGSPMSATDIPITALTIDPCERDASQSVPPEMRYGAAHTKTGHSIVRSQSALSTPRPIHRPSFTPAIAPVDEHSASTAVPPVVSEEELANHEGWMRKRTATRLMKHEWQDRYFSLHGTHLDMFEHETETSRALQSINVDDYVLHAYSKASSSKLSAALKKSMGASTEPQFAFSLIPENQKSTKLFEKNKGHHFAVDSGKDRIEWMRKLMLAKAMKKNDGRI